MALQSSGAISINDIVTEFGGTAPHSLSEYYGVASGIPTSGTIAVADFYGAAADSAPTGGTTGVMAPAYDGVASSCWYLGDRVGYGLQGCNDFYFPESVSSASYTCGFGTLTNAANLACGTTTMITATCYPSSNNFPTRQVVVGFAINSGYSCATQNLKGWTCLLFYGCYPGVGNICRSITSNGSCYWYLYRIGDCSATAAWWNFHGCFYNGSAYVYHYNADLLDIECMIRYAADNSLCVSVTAYS